MCAALAEIVNEEMAPVLGQIVNRMLESVKSEDFIPTLEDDSVAECNGHDGNADDIDIEHSDDGDDEDEFAGQLNVRKGFYSSVRFVQRSSLIRRIYLVPMDCSSAKLGIVIVPF